MTGASRGIRRATAFTMAHAGAYVLLHYGKFHTDADSVVAEIRSNGGNADAVGSDLAVPDGASRLAAKVRAFAGDQLDIIVANADISGLLRLSRKPSTSAFSLWLTDVRLGYH